VGSTIPAIAEVIEDGRTGRTVPVGDVDALAEALQSAYDQRATFGPAAREEVLSTYSREASARRLAEVLRSAAGR